MSKPLPFQSKLMRDMSVMVARYIVVAIIVIFRMETDQAVTSVEIKSTNREMKLNTGHKFAVHHAVCSHSNWYKSQRKQRNRVNVNSSLRCVPQLFPIFKMPATRMTPAQSDVFKR
jgi:hypothetical protein